MIGSAVAIALGAGFVPIRKKGKLPWETISEDYVLEYGMETLELHTDALNPGEHVLLVDDLIATGGTAVAAIKLVERLGADVNHVSFIVELPDLGGREVLAAMGLQVSSLCVFSGH